MYRLQPFRICDFKGHDYEFNMEEQDVTVNADTVITHEGNTFKFPKAEVIPVVIQIQHCKRCDVKMAAGAEINAQIVLYVETKYGIRFRTGMQ